MFSKYGPMAVGIPLLALGFLWVVSPINAAGSLSSELLTGPALTTQIGDSAAFFLGSGFLLFVGGLKRDATMILIGGSLVGIVAPIRIIAAVAHGGDMTLEPIVVEIITFLVAIMAARQIEGASRDTAHG